MARRALLTAIGLQLRTGITVKGVNTAPAAQTLPRMKYERMYANAVVLPNGKVSSLAVRRMARASKTRTASCGQKSGILPPHQCLHSGCADCGATQLSLDVAADSQRTREERGRRLVLRGWQPSRRNHPDMQFYSPSYLFDASGNAAARPRITKLASSQQNGNQTRVSPGGTLTVTLNSASGRSQVLIRRDRRRTRSTQINAASL